MALKYPGATWDPLGTQTEPAMTSHDVLCAHTMVGSLAGTSSMFHDNGYGGTESHFGVGESKAQGMKQWQDLMHEADANLEGHHRVVSFETADYGGVFGKWDTSSDANVPAWTADQLDMIINLVVWFCRKDTHANCPSTWRCHQVGVPCVLIPDSKPGRRGIGYHKQGCDPWRVDGGEKWSTAYGKGCPGGRRINQLINIVIPRARAILAGADLSGSLDMDFTDPIPGYTDPDGTPLTVGEALVRGNYAYRNGPVAGSATDNRLVTLEARVGPTTDAHAQYAYAAVIEDGTVDRRLDANEARLDKVEADVAAIAPKA